MPHKFYLYLIKNSEKKISIKHCLSMYQISIQNVFYLPTVETWKTFIWFQNIVAHYTFKFRLKTGFVVFGLKTEFFIIVRRGLCANLVEFSLNLSGATSFWVSTRVRESLLNAKKTQFFFIFLCELYMSLSHT